MHKFSPFNLNHYWALATTAALVLPACGGDTSSPDDEGADAADTSDTDTNAADDNSSDATDNMADNAGSMIAANGCEIVPPNGNISDFTIWNESGDTKWGDAMSLTGGTFTYQDGDNDPVVADVDTAAGTLTLTGRIPTYAGWGIWFGPACSDASAFDGIAFTISGDLGVQGQLEVQAQMRSNYPIEASKGACEYEEEANKWSECSNNKTIVEGVNAEPMEFQLPWSDFAGGTPIDGMDETEIMGIQWQFNCGEADTVCDLNVVFDEIRFY